jgi:hypothetical protein
LDFQQEKLGNANSSQPMLGKIHISSLAFPVTISIVFKYLNGPLVLKMRVLIWNYGNSLIGLFVCFADEMSRRILLPRRFPVKHWKEAQEFLQCPKR